jgi:tetratricopeptide (TPR) repeat protein
MTMTSGQKLARARDALERNDADVALAEVRDVLAADPRSIDALALRYRIECDRKQIVDAQKTLALVLSIDPHADWAYNDLIRLLFGNGRQADAERIARAALRMNPDNAIAHDLFGTILSETNDLPSGEWHFRRALQLGNANAQVTANLALNLMQQGRIDEADGYYERADEAAPRNLRILSHWSKLAEVQGDLPRAVQLLERAAAAAAPLDTNLLRARLLIRQRSYAQALELLEACGEMNGDGHLERGWLYDRLGRYDEAWQDFVEGKKKLAAQSGNLAYQKEAVAAFIGALKRFFVRRNIERLPQAPRRHDVPQPIFVCGLPRSGTTLLEQILSSHPQVRAGGELSFAAYLRNLANRLFPDDGAFPENLSRTWTADGHYVAALFRDYYLTRAKQAKLLDTGRGFFVDKMPFNELYLPLIRMAFPHSAIIRVVRHPLDVCVSMLSHNFTHGFNCGYRPLDVATHIAAMFDLVQQYRREMPSQELVVKYEDLVAHQEEITRRLLDHAGLPFDDACLRFHENARYAATPSYAQVAEQLNDRSVGRHRHYAAHLGEYLPLLRPAMSAMSYERCFIPG